MHDTTKFHIYSADPIYRAFSYNGLDEFDKAIADLDKAVELDPDDLATYTDRGKTKGYINDLEGAKKDFLFVLTRDTVGDQAKAAYHYLGKISYAEKHFEQSIRYFNKLISLVPRDSDAYFTRGAAKGMISDLAGSIEDYSKAIGIDPDFAEAYANRGVAKINLLTRNGNIQPTQKQTKDACKDLRKAKQLGDDSVDDLIFIYCEKK